MIRSVRARRVVFSLSAWLLCAAMRAATYLPMSDADLIRQAPTIVRAEVLDQTVRVDRVGANDLPFTIVTLRVLETFQGGVEEATFRVRVPGGTDGDRAWAIPGTPAFTPGEEVVLMLDTFADGSGERRLTELGLSKFELVYDEGGRRFAIRSAFSAEADLQLSRVGAPLEAVAISDPSAAPARDAESFLAALRAARRGDERRRRSPTRSPRAASCAIRPAACTPMGQHRRVRAEQRAVSVVLGARAALSDGDRRHHGDAVEPGQRRFLRHGLQLLRPERGHGLARRRVGRRAPDRARELPETSGCILDAASSQDGGVAWNTPFGCSGGVIGLGGPDPSFRRPAYKGDSPYFAIPAGTVSMRKSNCATGRYSGRVFKSALLHETGHALGLGHPGTDPSHSESTSIHSSTVPADWTTAVMHWSIPPANPSVPQTDDVQAIQYLYGTTSVGPMTPVANFSFSPSTPAAGSPSTSRTPRAARRPAALGLRRPSDRLPRSKSRHVFAAHRQLRGQALRGKLRRNGVATKTVPWLPGALRRRARRTTRRCV